MIKYAELEEPNPTASSHDPWSLRQAIVYQKYYNQSRTSEQILVRPSQAMLKSLNKTFTSSQSDAVMYVLSWASIHATSWGAASENWRHYINYLDGKLTKVVGNPY